MIRESIRPMTTDERASLQRAMGPQPTGAWQSDAPREAWGMAAVCVLVLVVIELAGGRNIGGFVAALAVCAVVGGFPLARAAVRNASRRKRLAAHAARRSRDLARVLEDGRVTVRRVRAVAVVEIEPLEDEGTGYVFDLGDGRVLFIKGQDYFPADDEAPWPNTEFEIVRAAADGGVLDVHCLGAALPPFRVVHRDDVDPETGWDTREEVLHMSMDDAVGTVLRGR